MNPRVDIVVPCYNYAEYLRVCIDSLLSQADVEVRVLILDDCSSDDSPRIGEALARADSRVTFRRHQQNRGHIVTYNEGIEWVAAPYWLLISADDLLTPGALARATAVMENHPGVAMVHGRQIAFAHEPQLPPEYACPGSSIVSGPMFIESVCASGENPVATPTVVARTSIQRLVGGYEPSLPHTADLEMWLRFASHGDIGQLAAFQAFKRGHDRNMQHSYVRRGTGDIVERREAFMRFLGREECPIQERAALRRGVDESLAASAFWRGARLFDNGLGDDAKQLFDLALQFDPALSSRREWRRMQVKRWLGAHVWRSIARAATAMAHILNKRDPANHRLPDAELSNGPGVRTATE